MAEITVAWVAMIVGFGLLIWTLYMVWDLIRFIIWKDGASKSWDRFIKWEEQAGRGAEALREYQKALEADKVIKAQEDASIGSWSAYIAKETEAGRGSEALKKYTKHLESLSSTGPTSTDNSDK